MAAGRRLVVTGAAGFLGRRLIESLAATWSIEAVDRNEAPAGLAPAGRPVRWHRVDLAEREEVARLVERLRAEGGATCLLHLAAHYDYTGRRHPEYRRTNVLATRRLLELAGGLNLERFVFASSVAACDFPPPGAALDERSPADGRHPYAESKAAGEAMVRAERRYPTAIVRLAALFSDWCEYLPLYFFLETWLSRRWDRRLLGGRGLSAVPYLHARDACRALSRVLDLRRELEQGEVLLLGPNGATSHRELYRAATAPSGCPAAVGVPKPAAALGIVARALAARAFGGEAFERPWMIGMIDRSLAIDAHRTHERLRWWPAERLGIVHRMPFLLESRRSQPWLWATRNRARMLGAEPPEEHRVARLLEGHEDPIFTRLTAALVAGRVSFPHDAAVALFGGLCRSVRQCDRAGFAAECRELARRRAERGRPAAELLEVLRLLHGVALEVVLAEPRPAPLERAVRRALAELLDFGLDGVEDGYEEAGANADWDADSLRRAR